MMKTRTPRQIDTMRRDSGLSPSTDESDGFSPTSQTDDMIDRDQRDGGDSGVGSPSPHSTLRSFGRRYTRAAELRKLRYIQTAIEQLSAAYGGEVVFSYKSRVHPNLPSLLSDEMKIIIPEKAVETQDPDPVVSSSKPGYFLNRSGLSIRDILANRLPSMPSGGLAVISNGLAIDLYKLSRSKTDLGPIVVKYIFHFLELNFPPVLRIKATDITLAHMDDNAKYVDNCADRKEVVNFLFSPFVVPEEVSEMASVMEDLDQDFDNLTESACEPEAQSVQESSDQQSDAYIVCDIGNGSLETFQISSMVDSCDEVNQVPNPGGELDSWTSVQQENYNIIQTEDGLFSVTATVLDLGGTEEENVALQQEDGQFSQAAVNGVGQGSEESLGAKDEGLTKPTFGANKMKEGDWPRKRSRTREVNIPSRFKDFDTVSPCKRSK